MYTKEGSKWWLKHLGPWEAQTEFWAPGFKLSKSQMLQAFGKWTVDERLIDLSLALNLLLLLK